MGSFNPRFSTRGRPPKPEGVTIKAEKYSMNVTGQVSKVTDERIKVISKERGIPISNLVAIALDNELDLEVPFNYPVPIPEEYDSDGFIQEASAILEFMRRTYPMSYTLEQLMLMRHDMKIESREVFLKAFPTILERGYIRKTLDTSRKKFEYPETIIFYEWVDHDKQAESKRERLKRLEREALMLRQDLGDE